jgi:GTP cyclohydrolase IA
MSAGEPNVTESCGLAQDPSADRCRKSHPGAGPGVSPMLILKKFLASALLGTMNLSCADPRESSDAVGALSEAERSDMVTAAARKIEELFDVLRVDYANDQHTRTTPQRVARMFVEELLFGHYTAPPEFTEFENLSGYDELIVTGPIGVRSTCAHHLLPIFGEAYLGILPSPTGRIFGLSKYDRIVNHFAARLQVQEMLTRQIGEYILQVTKPRGLAVRISAVHMCKTQRGVRASTRSRMVSTAYFGELLNDGARKDEFLQECLMLESGRPT